MRRIGIARERQEMEEIKNEEDEKGREQREGGPYLLYPLIHITWQKEDSKTNIQPIYLL